MSFNGSGTFNINTTGQPVVTGTVISSSVFNALTADLATGLTTCITKDGQTTVTANIPMNSFKFTGLAAGTSANDSVRLSQLQAGGTTLVTVSGTDTYTGTMSPALAAYAAGNTFSFVVPNTNTTSCTLNIDGLGAKAITRDGSTALVAGDLVANSEVVVVYDGTRFQVLNSNSKTNFNLSGTLTVAGNTTLSGGTANGVAYLNGSKVLTTGSALTFDGTNFATTGTASATKFIPTGGTATGNGMYLPTTNQLAFSTNGTEAVRVDASQNVGIGTTSPATITDIVAVAPVLSVRSSSTSDASRQATLRLNVPSSGGSDPAGKIIFSYGSGYTQNAAIDSILSGGGSAGILRFFTSTTERMRIDSSGEVYIAGTTDQGAYNLQCNGTGVWGAGAYVNGSDERLKDNIESLDSCLDVVNALRPVTFRYKPEHNKDQSVQTGFIAQELQQALAGKPYLEGLVQEGPNHLNVAYQNIIPLLTKAIQEQQAMIDNLKAEVAALKGA